MNKLPKRNRGSGPGELKHWTKVEPWPLRLRRGAAARAVWRVVWPDVPSPRETTP